VTTVVAGALSVLIVLVSAYFWSSYRSLNNHLHRLSIDTGGQAQAQGSSGGSAASDIDGKDENLLIAGNDDRSDMTDAEVRALHTGRDGGSLNTDTMMIVHVPANGSKATLISLPRDSYVSIPGYGMNKLNAAYAFGYRDAGGSPDAKRAAGANLLIKTVHALTGLTIDHFIQVDFIGFYRIAQAVGGVPVNLCRNVNDTYAYNQATGQGGGSGFKMSKGRHVLNAIEALEFVRQRHNLPNGDLDRTKRQRYFLTAAFRQVASAGTLVSPSKLRNLVNAVDRSLYVDSGFDITTLVQQMANLSANNIDGKAIPFQRFADTSVGNVEIVSPAQVQHFVDQLINGSTPEPSPLAAATTVAPSSVKVAVLNASAANGAAAQNAATLTKAGFSASAGNFTGQAPARTTIEYSSGMEDQAKTLERYVPGATVQQAQVSTLTLVLAGDNVSARSSAVAAASSSASSSPSSSPTTTPAHKPLDAGCIN
jgi:LCP family protein required for cell wall assembly